MKERSPVVFIVDDDEAVRSSLRLLLKSMGLVPSALASAASSWINKTRARLMEKMSATR
jgi:FixJ family two-component response regulator